MASRSSFSLHRLQPRARSVSPPPQDGQKTTAQRRHSDRGPRRRLYASAKRNQAFHLLFRTVPEDDTLIQVYTCALQKQILLQGHLYVAEHHVCFSSNILGFRTTVALTYTEITSIEKRKTALMFPNGITITTANDKFIFASFLTRDHAYDQLVYIWKLRNQKANGTQDNSSKPSADEHNDRDSQRTISQSHTETPTKREKRPPMITIQPPPPKQPLSRPHVTFSGEFQDCQCGQRHRGIVALNKTYTGFSVKSMHRLLFLDNGFTTGFLTKMLHCNEFTIGEWENDKRHCVYSIPSDQDMSLSVPWLVDDCVTASKLDSHVSIASTTRIQHTSFSINSLLCITSVHEHHQTVNVLVTFHITHNYSGLVSSVLEQDIIRQYKLLFNRLHTALQRPYQYLDKSHLHASHDGLRLTRLWRWITRATLDWRRVKRSHAIVILVLVILATNISTTYHLVRITDHLQRIEPPPLLPSPPPLIPTLSPHHHLDSLSKMPLRKTSENNLQRSLDDVQRMVSDAVERVMQINTAAQDLQEQKET